MTLIYRTTMRQQDTNEVTRSGLRMHKNMQSIDQPENTFIHALNIHPSDKQSSTTRSTTTLSTKQCEAFPQGFILVGDIYINNNEFVVFTTNQETSHIARVDKNCNYTIIVDEPTLNFQGTHKVYGTYRLWQGCEDVIYFVDDFNPNRQFNFSRLNNYKTNNTWDVDKFRIQKVTEQPYFKRVEVRNGGGNVLSGSVVIGIRMLDENLNPTKFFSTSREVRVYENAFDIPEGTIGTETNKSIEIEIANLNLEYPFYELVFIPINAGDGLDKTPLL